jgi:hypothetical protein
MLNIIHSNSILNIIGVLLMKSKKDIDKMIADTIQEIANNNGTLRKRDDLDGRLIGLQWGREKSKEEIHEKINELTKRCPAYKWQLADKKTQGHIRALQWIVRSYKDEKKGRLGKNCRRTGTREAYEHYIKPRR